MKHADEQDCQVFLLRKYGGRMTEISRAQPLLFSHTVAAETNERQFQYLLSLVQDRVDFVEVNI